METTETLVEKPKKQPKKLTTYAFPREWVTIEAESMEEAISILNSK